MPLIDCYRWVVPLVGCATDGNATDLEGVLMGQGWQRRNGALPSKILLVYFCYP